LCIPQWEKDWWSALFSEAVAKVSCGDMAKKLLTFQNDIQPTLEAGCGATAFKGVNPVAKLRKELDLCGYFLDQ